MFLKAALVGFITEVLLNHQVKIEGYYKWSYNQIHQII